MQYFNFGPVAYQISLKITEMIKKIKLSKYIGIEILICKKAKKLYSELSYFARLLFEFLRKQFYFISNVDFIVSKVKQYYQP